MPEGPGPLAAKPGLLVSPGCAHVPVFRGRATISGRRYKMFICEPCGMLLPVLADDEEGEADDACLRPGTGLPGLPGLA